VSGETDVSPAERTDLAWQRTGLGLVSVGGLLGARALKSGAPALLGWGLAVLTVFVLALIVTSSLRH